jgi:purine-cytosine permease-like protein
MSSSTSHAVAPEAESFSEGARDDYTTSPVPLAARRSTLNMTLVWITGNAAFSTLYTGYSLYQGGFSLTDMLIASLVGDVILGLYWFSAAYLGSRFGQTETLLARTFLGRAGSLVVSALIIIASVGWYSFQANLLGIAISSLAGIPGDVKILSLGCGIIMMFNNAFGFKSVSAWAKWIAAPLLTLWVLWAFAKAFAETPSSKLLATPHVAGAVGFGVAVSTFIGAVIWGSEPDFWRWSKPKASTSIVPIVVALVLGNLLFPLAGAALAASQNITDFGHVITFITSYTLGFAAIGVIIFVITQVAVNDLNLYEVVTAAKNLFAGPRIIYVLVFGLIGSVFAYFQVINHYTTIAELTGVLVPCATVVMILDAFVVPRLFGIRRPAEKVTAWGAAGQANVPGLLAIAAGLVVGGFTGGIFTASTTWGIGPLQAWAAATVVYLAGVAVVRAVFTGETRDRVLGFPIAAAGLVPVPEDAGLPAALPAQPAAEAP